MDAENLPTNDGLISIDGNSVSMKLVQSIYNEITGKKEKITQYLKDAYEVEFEDIHQLDMKINQLYEQYNIVNKNCSIEIYHINDASERFSSFERFKFYDRSSTSPCERVSLEYNFLIVLPNIKAPQTYKIKVDLLSRIGVGERESLETGMSRTLLRYVGLIVGKVEIEYVDYTVARNFQVAIDDWYKAVKKNQSSTFVKVLQNNSEHFPFVFQFLTLMLTSFSVYSQATSFIKKNPTLETLFTGAVVAFGVIYIAGFVAQKVGRIGEYLIDFYTPVSYVLLNRGDTQALSKCRSSNVKRFLGMIGVLLSAVIVNIVSLYITRLLKLE